MVQQGGQVNSNKNKVNFSFRLTVSAWVSPSSAQLVVISYAVTLTNRDDNLVGFCFFVILIFLNDC